MHSSWITSRDRCSKSMGCFIFSDDRKRKVLCRDVDLQLLFFMVGTVCNFSALFVIVCNVGLLVICAVLVSVSGRVFIVSSRVIRWFWIQNGNDTNTTQQHKHNNTQTIFDFPHFGELRMNLPVFERTLRSCRTSDRGFALAEELVSLLRNVRTQYRVAVALGSVIRQAVALRESWIRDVCARGRLCKPPDHWSRTT